jgi:cysteinyl-tRNA synthetase
MIRIHDNLDRKKKEFVPVKPGHVGIYVCGMTVQGPPHVGHIRASLSGDVISRWLEHKGFNVTVVQNFTDIDDKIIEKANAEGVEYQVIAERNIAEWLTAARAMGIREPDVAPKATEHIPEIHALIQQLIDKGAAYAAGGDVYFAVEAFREYGKLSGRTPDELRAGARIEIGEAKRNPMDFTLWKGAKPGEPAWESPWGRGRPGWHIECSAMAMKYLGTKLDLHGGGIDLIFPHHENEVAQSEMATGARFCNFWTENGLVNMDGRKMSKSEGHLFLAREILAEIDAETVRFYLVSTHYKSPIEFSRERLAEADRALDRFRNFFHNMSLVDGASPAPPSRPESSRVSIGVSFNVAAGDPGSNATAAPMIALPASLSPEGEAVRARVDESARLFEEAMDDDFNSALALAHLFDLVKELNGYDLRAKPSPEKSALLRFGEAAVRRLGGLLGLFEGLGRSVSIPEAVLQRVNERNEARAAKDWARADAIRNALRAEGYILEDRAAGTSVKIASD